MKMKKKVLISMLAVSATLALGAFMGGCSLSDKIEQWRCDHENITENVVIDPTCYEKGEMKETCDDCGKTWTEDIEKVAHTWNDGEVVVEATCTETGIARYTCTVEGCEAVEDRVTDKVEHTRVEMPAVAPTCTTVGYTEWSKCGDCGLVLTKKQELPALGHVEMALKAVAPTCTETGLTAGVGCATCGEVITAQTVIPVTGHNIVTVAGKAPTCVEAGLTNGQKCDDCGKVFVEQTEIPVTEHKDENMDDTCDVCGFVNFIEVGESDIMSFGRYRIYRVESPLTFDMNIMKVGEGIKMVTLCVGSTTTQGEGDRLDLYNVSEQDIIEIHSYENYVEFVFKDGTGTTTDGNLITARPSDYDILTYDVNVKVYKVESFNEVDE